MWFCRVDQVGIGPGFATAVRTRAGGTAGGREWPSLAGGHDEVVVEGRGTPEWLKFGVEPNV